MANRHNIMSSNTRVLTDSPVQIAAVIQGEIIPLTETSCDKRLLN